jgi:hypothetical protein
MAVAQATTLKAVEAQHRLGYPLGGHGVDPFRAVGGSVGQQRAASPGRQETPQRRGVTARGADNNQLVT